MDPFSAYRDVKRCASSSFGSDASTDDQQHKRAKTEEEQPAPAAPAKAVEQGLAGSSSLASSSEATGLAPDPGFEFPSLDNGAFTPTACSSFLSSFSMEDPPAAGGKNKEVEPACLLGEDVDYIRDHCVVPSEDLKTFRDVIGNPQCAAFAEQWQPVVSAAERAISGLLLFGPSGTGKSLCAQAIASHHNATFYCFGAADLPNGKAGANRVNALFDVAIADATPEKPAVIFIDECDTVLSAKATVRAGHFATRFERFMPNLLVIGATNEPQNIAPKILTGRFERKIYVGNPNGDARRHMILRQLAQGEKDHAMSSSELDTLVQNTAGRSAVNMQRLISTAVQRAGHLLVMQMHFERAMIEEPSDYDPVIAEKNAKYNTKHGWRGNVSPCLERALPCTRQPCTHQPLPSLTRPHAHPLCLSACARRRDGTLSGAAGTAFGNIVRGRCARAASTGRYGGSSRAHATIRGAPRQTLRSARFCTRATWRSSRMMACGCAAADG